MSTKIENEQKNPVGILELKNITEIKNLMYLDLNGMT